MRPDPKRHGGAVAGGEVSCPRRLPAAGQSGDIRLSWWRCAGPVAEAQDPAPDLGYGMVHHRSGQRLE